MVKDVDTLAKPLAELGPKPTMLYHLNNKDGKWVLSYKIPVIEGHKPSNLSLSYDQLAVEVRDAISSLVWDANGNNPDLIDHPWALHSVWKLQASPGLGVILEWQPASATPRTNVIGENTTPVMRSRTFMLAPSWSSSMAEADETSSILYVISKGGHT